MRGANSCGIWPDRTREELQPWVLVLAAIIPLIVLFQAFESYYAHRIPFDFHDDIRRSLVDAFERLALALFVHRGSGAVTAAATLDLELIELYTSHHLPTIVATVVPCCAAVGLAVLLVVLAPS